LVMPAPSPVAPGDHMRRERRRRTVQSPATLPSARPALSSSPDSTVPRSTRHWAGPGQPAGRSIGINYPRRWPGRAGLDRPQGIAFLSRRESKPLLNAARQPRVRDPPLRWASHMPPLTRPCVPSRHIRCDTSTRIRAAMHHLHAWSSSRWLRTPPGAGRPARPRRDHQHRWTDLKMSLPSPRSSN